MDENKEQEKANKFVRVQIEEEDDEEEETTS